MVKGTALSLFIVLILVPLTLQAAQDQFLKQCKIDGECSDGECCSKSFFGGDQGYCKQDLEDGEYCRVSSQPTCPRCGRGFYCKQIFMFGGRCTSSLKEP